MVTMDGDRSGVLGTPKNIVSVFDAFNYLTGSISSTLGIYYRDKLSRIDARLNSQLLANDVRSRAVKAASAAAAIFSVASIDVSAGTPNALVKKSIGEGAREASRILETTL
jgi:hypothetical protein